MGTSVGRSFQKERKINVKNLWGGVWWKAWQGALEIAKKTTRLN